MGLELAEVASYVFEGPGSGMVGWEEESCEENLGLDKGNGRLSFPGCSKGGLGGQARRDGDRFEDRRSNDDERDNDLA